MFKKLSRIIKTSLLILISTLAAVLFCELVVRLFLPQDKMVTWIQMHPEGFVMNQPGGFAFQELGERRAEYRFNSNRLRGSSVDSQKVNVLTIGDSFTFGLLLNEENTYVHLLQEKANALYPDSLQFLNGGVGGAGMADWPAWVDKFGPDLEIDYILYFLNYDDIQRALSKNIYIFDPSAPDSLMRSQRWQPRALMRYFEQRKSYRWLQANSELANILVKLMWRNLYFKDLTHEFDPAKSSVEIPELESFSEDSEYSLNLGAAILDKLDSWCTQNGCEFLVFTTGFFDDETMSAYDEKFYRYYKTTLLETREHFFDNQACVEDRASSGIQELIIPGDTHPNEQGAKTIADCTWEELIIKFEDNQTQKKP